jgi:hypothetical protein
MNRKNLISVSTLLYSTAAIVLAVVSSSCANAQEKRFSVGPAIEFSGGGTSFGIKGRISNPGTPVSVRPIVAPAAARTLHSCRRSQLPEQV